MSKRDPDPRPERPYMAETLRLRDEAERRKPTGADAPKLSTLPMTRAAREALRMSRAKP